MTSTALKTDHYELTMLAAALSNGVAHRRATFEAFARRLPEGRHYGVVGGIGRLLEAIENFRFGDEELAFLADRNVVGSDTLDYLANYRFAGDIVTYREGELYFPYSPVLTVDATFGDAVLIETLILSILNHDSAIASAGARIADAAAGRRLIEMGGRRTHDEAAVAAARMAYLVGFDVTSNLEAGRRYNIPTAGTSAHAFTLAHLDESDAFAAQMDALGVETTLLVDTYDIADAIRVGVKLANERGAAGPGAIRIDSGDLTVEATAARELLDSLGAVDTKIVVSSDLDEYTITDLVERGAPVDALGVGTRLATGSGHPTAGFVYKLVAIADSCDEGALMRPVAKKSASKISVGGRKRAWRMLDGEGFAYDEHVAVRNTGRATDIGQVDGPEGRNLQVVAFEGGERVWNPSNAEIRSHHKAALSELRPLYRLPVAGRPALQAEPRG